MTYAIHASKNGQSVVTIRINPIGAVDKARLLESLGWQVHITDSAGHQFNSIDFDRFCGLREKRRDRGCYRAAEFFPESPNRIAAL
jgi:hypothetical protein